jgi:hypothetical protein
MENFERIKNFLYRRYLRTYLKYFDEAELESDIGFIYAEHICGKELEFPLGYAIKVFSRKMYDKLQYHGVYKGFEYRRVNITYDVEYEDIATVDNGNKEIMAVIDSRVEQMPQICIDIIELTYYQGIDLSEAIKKVGLTKQKGIQLHRKICEYLKTGDLEKLKRIVSNMKDNV